MFLFLEFIVPYTKVKMLDIVGEKVIIFTHISFAHLSYCNADMMVNADSILKGKNQNY